MTEPPVVSSSYPSLAAHPKAATPASAAPAGRAPILVLSGLTKRYGAVLASDAVSLDVRRGEIHALIGPNGAGKSTLVKQVSGEISPDQGRVLVDGVDVTDQSAPERARAGLARCFQVSALALELTALPADKLAQLLNPKNLL